jgi:hypothetical protein
VPAAAGEAGGVILVAGAGELGSWECGGWFTGP